MRRENMTFVQEKVKQASIKPMGVREIILDSICKAKDGFTFGELYKLHSTYSPRHIRGAIQELVNSQLITNTRKCRCHAATIYEGIP